MSNSEATPVAWPRETCGGADKVGGTSTVILLAAVLFFLTAVCFVLFICMYAKWRFGPRAATAEHEHRDDPAVQGLSPDAIKSLPTVVFESSKNDGMECAVCLSEIVGGEKARFLPNCGHGFHVECIDMWLFSHSTCPLCRNPVGTGQLETPVVASAHYGSSASSLPTNVLFWGTPSGSVQEAHSSSVPTPSSAEGTLVIDITTSAIEGFGFPSTMTTPNPTRLRSLRRLLSRGKRAVGLAGCSASPAEAVDVEQGVVGRSPTPVTTPKTTPADL